MPWRPLRLCRLLSLLEKAPLDYYYPQKVQQGRRKGRRKSRNTQYPALSQPLTSSMWPQLLSLWPGLPTSSPHGLTLRELPHPSPAAPHKWWSGLHPLSTVWGEESVWCGSSCEAPRGFPGYLPLSLPHAAAGTPGPPGEDSCLLCPLCRAGLASSASSWVGSAPWTTSSAVPIPFLSNHTSSKNHHARSVLLVFFFSPLYTFYRDFEVVATILQQWWTAYYQIFL